MDNQTPAVLQKQLTEKIAIANIIFFLLSHKIITAEPAVDMNGADLLALIQIEDGAKFARIQCKGRKVADPESRNPVEVIKTYVTGTFTLLLNVDYAFNSTHHLFCFFANDIKARPDLWKVTENEYVLTLHGKSFENQLDLFRFTESRVGVLKEIIRDSEMGKDFAYGFAKGNIRLPRLKVTGTMSSS
jgi:hypothetical protein